MLDSRRQAQRVGFVGLGAMGLGMATHLVTLGYTVTGHDTYAPSSEKFQKAGGRIASSPREVAQDCQMFLCMVASSQQAQSVFFDPGSGAVAALPPNSAIVISSTVPADYVRALSNSLVELGRSDLLLVDAPVSGGTVKAAAGSLTILASGSNEALDAVDGLLCDLSAHLHRIPGGLGSASNVKMVNQLLAGVHIATAAEAMALAARAGLNTRSVYEIITNAAGNSWMFENRVPHMLDADWTPKSALDIFVKDMGIVTSTARSLNFPVPLSSAAEQLYLSGSAHGFGREDDSGLVRLFLPQNPLAVHDQVKSAIVEDTISPATTPLELEKIGFVGLGAMGLGMASSLVRASLLVEGYDIHPPSIDKFLEAGDTAKKVASPAEAAIGAQVFIVMVQNHGQAMDVIFGQGKAAESLPIGAIVIIMATIPTSQMQFIGQKLAALGKGIELIDAPVSGGVARAASGQLTIISSGSSTALSKAQRVLLAMCGQTKNLYTVPGGVGAASTVKMINQLLAGVHIAAAAEAMALAAKLGLDTRSLYKIICSAAGSSWMYENRVPAMLNTDWTPHSALDIFVKDLGIVLDETKRLTFAAPMSAAAHQLYLFGASSGLGKEADSGVVRVWESMTGVSVAKNVQALSFQPKKYPRLAAKDVLEALPPVHSADTLNMIESQVKTNKVPTLVVLDDDPTGTQTCHDIAVLTCWDQDTLVAEFKTSRAGFFILTNSRALPPHEAKALVSEICGQVSIAARTSSCDFQIVLRGDSTLRGHIPDEPEAVESQLGRVDAWVIAPFFYQGGRYTIDDVHYIHEGDVLVPVAETPFALDATFGYKSSNLRHYILEKTGNRFNASSFTSISLGDLRTGGPSRVTTILTSAPPDSVIIVNAASEQDMYVFALAALAAESAGKRYLYRTGAAFVSARLGIRPIPPLPLASTGYTTPSKSPRTGGLIIAGSHVPKTSTQLARLRSSRGSKLTTIELDVVSLLSSSQNTTCPQAPSTLIAVAATQANTLLAQGQDVLIMTSRTLITGSDPLSSLSISAAVAKALVELVQAITVRPRYLIAKGGITASDAATKALGIRRAVVLGQAAPGVPLWRCDDPEAMRNGRHVGLPFVVFPGNVGGEGALAELVERWDV